MHGALATKQRKVNLGALSLAAWFAVMVLVCAGLLARHLLALPSPETSRLGAAVARIRPPELDGRWLAVHVLYSECRCSKQVADHLAKTVRPRPWAEMVLWIGEGLLPPGLSEAGFRVVRVTPEELVKLGIEAAPALVALDPSNHVLYAGGYTERKQVSAIQDRRILDAVFSGASIESLPIFGCAVSQRLRGELAALPVP